MKSGSGMIKLTFLHDLPQGERIFLQERITLGANSADIVLSEGGLKTPHVELVVKNNEFWLYNLANDPFVQLNGTPFGRRRLKVGDIFKVRSAQFRVNEIQLHAPVTATPVYSPPPPPPPEPPLTVPTLPVMQAPIIRESSDIEELAAAIPKQAPISPPTPRSHLWKWVVSGVMLTLLLIGAVSTEFYMRTASTSEAEEMFAAEGLSDIAMALTYAQIHHIATQKQNWSDPDFLSNSLMALLSNTSLPCTNIDAQGKFSNCPYILRIYTSNDLTRFVLIAQPEASLSQWLIPKHAIIVDSNAMELRKTKDLKSINRLLASSCNMDNTLTGEIANLVQHGELIPLAAIARASGNEEFAPPRALAYLRPGAENLIYNAPRYHLFGETMIKKAIALDDMPENAHEISMLQSEMGILTRFKNMVLYSTEGMQPALEAYRGLTRLAPQGRFLTAYLTYSNSGKIRGSHLIIDAENSTNRPPLMAERAIGSLDTTIAQNERLRDPKIQRQQALAPYKDNLQKLLDAESEIPQEHFIEALTLYLNLYMKEDAYQTSQLEAPVLHAGFHSIPSSTSTTIH